MHDHGHPGLTADFLIATSDPLAVRYNDRSPLENHHGASFFALLRRPELNALAQLSPQERVAFRKQVCGARIRSKPRKQMYPPFQLLRLRQWSPSPPAPVLRTEPREP